MSDKRSNPAGSSNWLWPAIIYLGAMLFANLIWEIGQLPMYTIWQDGTSCQQAIAVVHCTLGDVLIATSALLLSLLIVGGGEWPKRHFTQVATIAVVIGLGYTIFSEWLNVHVLGSWSYSQLMPMISVGDLEIGISPLVQWSIIPTAAFLVTKCYVLRRR